MPWLKVDDGFESHPKVKTIPRGKRLRAIGLWTLAGSWSARTLTNGHIGPHMLDEFGATKTDAWQLAEVNLWHTTGHDCPSCPQPEDERGYVFHKWHDYQPTREKVEAERAEARERMRRIRNGASYPQAGSGDVRANISELRPKFGRSSEMFATPVPSRPVPSVVTTSSQSSSAPAELGDDGLTRIKRATKGNDDHARKVAEFILAKAPADVRNPTAYVLSAIYDQPGAYRFKRGNPKKGEECPTHAGQWAEVCAGCAADRKAGA